MQLIKDSPLPRYYQIAHILRSKIRQGYYRPGDKLPSELDFAKEFGVSRPTIRQALSLLVQEGLVIKEHGLGSFVAEPQVQYFRGRIRITSFADEMKAQGFDVKTLEHSVRVIKAAGEVAESLNLSPGDLVLEIKRLRAIHDNKPICFGINYIPETLVPGFANRINFKASLYHQLERDYGFQFVSGQETVTAVAAGKMVGAKLHLDPSSPLLLVTRINCSGSGFPIDFSKSYYDPSQYRYVVGLLGR